MEACLARSWNLAGPLVNTTPGDLEWWVSSASPGEDWSRRIRLWSDDDGVAAYGFFNPPGELDWHQRAGLAPGVRAGLVDETLAWLASAARAEAAAGSVAAPPALETWAMDADAELGDLLSARGWTPAPEPAYTHFHRRLDGPTRDGGPLDGPGRGGDPRGAPPPTLPPGYRLRHVRLPDDLEARVEVHRSAFAPSRMTVEKYRAVAAMPRYAAEHDLVVEAPDGSLAAFTMVWWIPEARLGEFEPVGTHASHRRLGLAGR